MAPKTARLSLITYAPFRRYVGVLRIANATGPLIFNLLKYGNSITLWHVLNQNKQKWSAKSILPGVLYNLQHY